MQSTNPLSLIEPLLLQAKDAAALCGIGLRTWHTYRASGKLPPSYRIAGRRIWKRRDIERWIEWNFPCLDKFIELSNLENKKGFTK